MTTKRCWQSYEYEEPGRLIVGFQTRGIIMDTLELRDLDVQELRNVNGGVCGPLCLIGVGIVIVSGTEIISDWDNFKRGLKSEPEK